MELDRATFEALVEQALDEIPDEIAGLVHNVVVLVEDEGPPRIERALMDLHHEDFRPILEASSRVLWPDPREYGSSPPS